MISKEIRQVRCDDVLSILTASGQCVFFTLTTPAVVDYAEIRRRWRLFRHEMVRALRSKGSSGGKKPLYVMNYEAHPGYLQKIVRDEHGDRVLRSDGQSHGWHIHGVINRYLPAKRFLRLARFCGFGRCDFRRVTSKGVSDYLTKHALKAYRGIVRREREKGADRVRLVNASRGLPPLSSYQYKSEFLSDVQHIKQEVLDDLSDTKLDFIKSGSDSDFKPDYLKISRRCQVLALLGLSRYHHFMLVLEWLQVRGSDGFAGFVQRLKWRGVFEQDELTNVKNVKKKSSGGAPVILDRSNLSIDGVAVKSRVVRLLLLIAACGSRPVKRDPGQMARAKPL